MTDTELLNWVDRYGPTLTMTESEQLDGTEVSTWMVGPDTDASNAWAFGLTIRIALTRAMENTHR